MKLKQVLKLAAKIIVAAVLLTLMYWRLSGADLGAKFSAIKPLPVVMFMALLLINTAISAWKWKLLLKADCADQPFYRLMASYQIASFFNMFLPSTIGGDAYRVASEAGGERLAKSFSSVFADRLSGFVALTGMGLVAALAGFRLLQRPGLVWVPAIMCLGFLSVALLAMNRTWAETLLKFMRMDRVAAIWRPVSKCLASFELYKKTPGLLSRILAWSFLFQTLVVVCIWLLAQALRIPAPISRFFIFVPLVSILEAAPVSIYGLGLRDFGYLLMFTQAGLPQPEADACALSLLYVACTALYASFGGLLFLNRMFIGKKRPAVNEGKT